MRWLEPARVTERVLLWGLALGFTLVVSVLGVAGAVAFRTTRAIEAEAAHVGREQLAMARLVNDLQAGQNAMAAILHQLGPGQPATKRDAIVADLEAADRALERAAAAARTSADGRIDVLGQSVRRLSDAVRAAASDARLDSGELEPLLALHDEIVLLERELIAAGEQRLSAADQRIAAQSHRLATSSRLLLGTGIILAILCAVGTLIFARTAIRRLEAHARELSRVSWHLLQSQESIARRFSHELHDELGQSLAAIRATVAADLPGWPSRQAECVRLIDQAVANVRELSQLLRPVILDDFGLDASLRWLAQGFAQRTGIHAEYRSTFQERTADDIETHLFRIAQEGLTNVARHSGATEVTLELLRVGTHLRLSLEDNGRGLPEGSPVSPSMGMIGMRARVREVNGTLRVSRPAGGGLRLEVSVPLPHAKDAASVDQDPHPSR